MRSPSFRRREADDDRRPLLIAHRGAKREHPENTISAFRRALELGADGIELDVHATADGVVVVHHDWVPAALTPAGEPPGRPICELTAAEIGSLEVAPGIPIPTLREVLALVDGRATVYVEMKGRDIEELVLAEIARSSTPCAVHSFHHESIAHARRLQPELARGILFDANIEELEARVEATGARDVWPHWSLVTEDVVRRAHALGCRVIVWTVNSVREARRLRRLGVDGLCGDDVRLLGARRAPVR